MKPERLDDSMLFDFEALWGSDHVKLMGGLELAVYVRLLSCQWREGDLQADPRLLALRASHGTRTVTPEELFGPGGTIEAPDAGSIWAALWPCYESDAGHVWNPRVREDRAAWLKKKKKWAKKSSVAGKASAKARRVRHKSTSGEPMVEPLVEPQVHSLSPSLSSSPPSPVEEGETKTSPPCSSDDERERAPSKAERDFETWWPLMPPKAKTGKAKALKAWCRLPADQRDAGPVVLFLDFLRESQAEVYVKEGGQYLPHGATFVGARPWEDDRESYPSGNGERGGGYDSEEIGAVEGYLLRKVHLEGLRALPEEIRDVDETDADLDRFEESIRLELEAINASPELKQELRAKLAAD